MLQQIHLTNFVVIENLELDFSQGMTVLTGETGAGKSIIIDALVLALGGRLQTKVVRTGAQRCDINVIFLMASKSAANQWLEERELARGNECIVRRTITEDGRSKSYINDQPVALQSLRELGEMLVNIHGQHEHQNLLKRDQQYLLVDEYAGHINLCEKVKNIFLRWLSVNEKLLELRTAYQDKNQRREFLTYQLNEFTKLALQPNEVEALTLEHKQLVHSDDLLLKYQNTLNLLVDDDKNSITNLLSASLNNIESALQVNPRLQNCFELLQNALIQIDEASTDIRDHLESVAIDPERLQKVEDRIMRIEDLARKHRIHALELIQFQDNLQNELSQLDNSDDQLEKLQQQSQSLTNDYKVAAEELTKSRKKASKELEKLVTANMQQLNMIGGQFQINLEPITKQSLAPNGLEQIEFLVSANPGQALQSLNKVASGGELSRISLAIQVITAQRVVTPTLIFDEVDVGIGGGVAEIVGRLLRNIGETTQVFCVTHLPQVAALAHQHLQVTKNTVNGVTTTEVRALNKKQKIQEIARMLGGVKITEQTLAHAEEMLELS